MVFNDFSYSASTQVMVKLASKNHRCEYKKHQNFTETLSENQWKHEYNVVVQVWIFLGTFGGPFFPSWPQVGTKLAAIWHLVGPK